MNSFKSNQSGSCEVQVRVAALATDFGMDLFLKKAGDAAKEILEDFGTFTKGRNEGKSRGYIQWIKVIRGGYDYSILNLGVVRGGSLGYRATKEMGVDYLSCDYDLEYCKKVLQDEVERIAILPDLIASKVSDVEKVKRQIEGIILDDSGFFGGDDEKERLIELNKKDIESRNETISKMKAELDKLKEKAL